MVAIDGSPHANYALDWTLANLVDYDQDVLHLVSVARREPDKVRSMALTCTHAQVATTCIQYRHGGVAGFLERHASGRERVDLSG